MKKFCTKCGHEFEAVGREVICPACKQAAAEESKKAAVLRAKRASWAGESVPVRISGRASTLIREYGKENNLPFAESLDELLKASTFFKNMGKAWEDITPYKSRRRDKATSTTEGTSTPQETPQDEQDKPVKPVKAAAKKAVKTTSKAGKATSTSTSKK